MNRERAEQIEQVIEKFREDFFYLFDDYGNTRLTMSLLSAVRSTAIDNGIKPVKILQILGVSKLEYRNIIF